MENHHNSTAKENECRSSRDICGAKPYQYLAALTGTLSAFSAGITLGWTAQIVEKLLNGSHGFPLTKDELGWIGSISSLGAALFSLLTGIISDCIGRKLTMLLLIIPATTGWCLIIMANSVYMLAAGRFMTGIAAGAFCVLSALYTSEIAHKSIRGSLGSFTQLMIISGVLYAAIFGSFLSLTTYTIVCAIVPLIFGILFVCMPESPVYLIKKKKLEVARSALIKLRGENYNVDDEIKEIENNLQNDNQSRWITVKMSLKKSSTKKACLIGFALMIFKVTCGVDATTEYTSYIFSSAKVHLDPHMQTIAVHIVAVITAIFQSIIVDKWGRKLLLCVSSLVMTIGLTMVGLAIYLKQNEIVTEEYYVYINYLPLIGLAINSVAFPLGLGPVPWIILGEIFPPEIKSLTTSVGTFLSWITAFAVTKLFFVMDSSWGGGVTFFVFAAFTFVTLLFVLIRVPETKNKSFDEIQRML